jgi:hypothetical protein
MRFGFQSAAAIVFRMIHFSIINRLNDYLAVNCLYLIFFKTLPDLRTPKTFNEKVAWRKLYQHDPRFSIFSDKIAAKVEVAKLIGESHVIETLWIGNSPDEIPFAKLEPPYVIKVNHSSGGNIFVRSWVDINKAQIISSVGRQLRLSHGKMFREWGYLNIPRMIMVERMIKTTDDVVPDDYKFFVYHGRVHFIQVDYDRFKVHKRNMYDRDWKLLPIKYTYPTTKEACYPPSNLTEMITIAEKIGAQFDFCRVDLYSIVRSLSGNSVSSERAVLFGEVTFYPGAGIEQFIPDVWDSIFGKPWEI